MYCIDNFLSDIDYQMVIDYCYTAPYHFGEKDNPHHPPTGMVSTIEEEWVKNLFQSEINSQVSEVEGKEPYRMYINCFAPGENPYYHTDGDEGITCLFYVNPNVEIDDGGSTQLILDRESVNLLPIPNRLCVFDANIIHRATSFRDKHRFTIAVKYN